MASNFFDHYLIAQRMGDEQYPNWQRVGIALYRASIGSSFVMDDGEERTAIERAIRWVDEEPAAVGMQFEVAGKVFRVDLLPSSAMRRRQMLPTSN